MAEKYETFWLTRDTNADGTLAELCDVWVESPQLMRLPEGGFAWAGPGVTGMESHLAKWTVDVAIKNCYTYPATGRECIRVG